MSKDLKPKQKLGQAGSGKGRAVMIGVILLAVAGGGFAAYRYNTNKPIEVPVAAARRADFVITVKVRGEIRSTRSKILMAPQVPDPTITMLAESGKMIKAGQPVIEFDTATLENTYLDRNSLMRTIDSEVVQTKASHKITDESDATNKMTAEYDVQRAELEASKAEILSEIEGAKNRIDVGVSKGSLEQVGVTIKSHEVTQQAEIDRLQTRKDKAERDMTRVKSYLSKMVVRAPSDGIVNLLPNFRAQGSWGSTPPPFKEGDKAWTGAAIAEIPDLTEMRIELKLDEVDRGKIKLGQPLKIRVDAIPDKEFEAELTWVSPIAALEFSRSRTAEKSFPAHALLKQLDPRLRPGMSASAEIVIDRQPSSLLIPLKASFSQGGKPMVWVQRGQGFEVRPIEVGRRNDSDIMVTAGLREGDRVALENPAEVAKRSKKF
ncbi:MAG TPA: HlyD family secretion protein [Bryobacteraceae bacterium]|nr:HlyD family secretion protein [Bryobacteraceae bacterium]